MIDKVVVVIESFLEENPNKVCVYGYEEETGTILIDVEVCSRDEAFNKYRVVGEILHGEVQLFSETGEDIDLDMFDEEFEDGDDE